MKVGDIVFYVPDCEGDRCAHDPVFDRAALVTKVLDDDRVCLTVFHPGAFACLTDVPRGGPGQLGTWYPA